MFPTRRSTPLRIFRDNVTSSFTSRSAAEDRADGLTATTSAGNISTTAATSSSTPAYPSHAAQSDIFPSQQLQEELQRHLPMSLELSSKTTPHTSKKPAISRASSSSSSSLSTSFLSPSLSLSPSPSPLPSSPSLSSISAPSSRLKRPSSRSSAANSTKRKLRLASDSIDTSFPTSTSPAPAAGVGLGIVPLKAPKQVSFDATATTATTTTTTTTNGTTSDAQLKNQTPPSSSRTNQNAQKRLQLKQTRSQSAGANVAPLNQQPLFTTFSCVPYGSSGMPRLSASSKHDSYLSYVKQSSSSSAAGSNGNGNGNGNGVRRSLTRRVMSENNLSSLGKERPSKRQKLQGHHGRSGVVDNNISSLNNSDNQHLNHSTSMPSGSSSSPPHSKIPEPKAMPLIEDDGTKPPYSYALLIGMAILRAPNRKLTLAQIYKWISDTFSYYVPGETGWQNSIRHNLSLNKAFVKQERPKDDPGKGNYWAIQPGMEAQFLKERGQLGKSLSMSSAGLSCLPQGVHRFEVLPQPQLKSRQQQQQQGGPATTPLAPSSLSQYVSTPAYSMPPPFNNDASAKQQQQQEEELSSDATLPASDPALRELDENTLGNGNRQATQPTSFPPPPPPPSLPSHTTPSHAPIDSQALKSSPPLMPPPMFHRVTTPPSPSRQRLLLLPTSSSTCKRTCFERGNDSKSNIHELKNDSGYYSSLESSALRPKQSNIVPAGSDIDVDPPKNMRGRAEEEIARIRSSSHDRSSPIPSTNFKNIGASGIAGGVGHGDSMPPPLTPAIKLKKPMNPPQSASPNTNLKNHRQKIQKMVASPVRSMGLVNDGDVFPWSPAFNIHDDTFNTTLSPHEFNSFHVPFDMFDTLPVPQNGNSSPTYKSPIKRHLPNTTNASRRSVGSSASLIDMPLADVTMSRKNSMLLPSLSPIKSARVKSLKYYESPSKSANGTTRSDTSATRRDLPSPPPPAPHSSPIALAAVTPQDDMGDADNADFFAFNLFSEDGIGGDVDGVDLLQGFEKIGNPVGSTNDENFTLQHRHRFWKSAGLNGNAATTLGEAVMQQQQQSQVKTRARTKAAGAAGNIGCI